MGKGEELKTGSAAMSTVHPQSVSGLKADSKIAPSQYIDPVKRKFIKPRTGQPGELQEAINHPELWMDATPYHYFSFCGASKCGKTSIVDRMFGRPYKPDIQPTVGGRFMFDLPKPFGEEADYVAVWDCAGAEYTEWHTRTDEKGKYLRELKYIAPNARHGRMIYRLQMRKTMGCKQTCIVIVYDATDRKSFDGVPDTVTGKIVNGVDMFYRWAKYRQGKDAYIALVAAKSDLDNQEVSPSEAEQKVAAWNSEHGDFCHFFETSAKDNTGIKEFTNQMAERLVLRHQDHKSKSVYPWQADRMKLIEDGYYPKDVEHVLLDEEGCVEKTIELFHNQDDMEDRIGLWE